jgi:SAM-dependent methyltransferase
VTQNIYDDPTFFAGYRGLPRSLEGLDGAPEWPALRAMLPDLKDRRVLDLGCGFGWFSRWAREAGASRVLAIGWPVDGYLNEGARSSDWLATGVVKQHRTLVRARRKWRLARIGRSSGSARCS